MDILNLDQYGRDKTSLAAQDRDYTQAVNFDIQNDRNIIGNTKLKNISFNRASGGTITLGGAGNGNGVAIVKDSGGTTRVTINNSGINVTGGNISISNALGSTIVDANGLNSIGNFYSAQVLNASIGTTASTTYVDVTGSNLPDLVLSRPTNAFIYFSIDGHNISFGKFCNVQYVDGTTQLQSLFVTGDYVLTTLSTNTVTFPDQGGTLRTCVTSVSGANNVYDEFAYFGQFTTTPLAAGTHSFKLQMKAEGGGTATLSNWLIGYFILGA